MNQQIADLLARYARAIGGDSQPSDELVDSYNTLRLADAALDKQRLNRAHPDHPLQVVILGPTQAGKSTLCNLLLDTNAAGISALAGYTVHAQGFASNVNESALEPLEDLMSPLTRVSLNHLNAQMLDHYVLESVIAGPNALVSQGVVWDSPDFDSIESGGYRGAVLQAVAMADVLILMVSKDKYADKSVWDMLQLVGRLGKPLFVCINKLDDQDKDTVIRSFQQRHLEQFNSEAPDIIALPFIRNTDASASDSGHQMATDYTISIDPTTRAAFAQLLDKVKSQVDRTGQDQHTDNYVKHHWPQWMEPLEREQNALNNWNTAVEDAIAEAKERYATRYLNNPEKYETFNKAIAELLTLLEVPGLAGALSKTRNLVTWPARKLFGMGKSIAQRDSQPADQELEILDQILDQTLTSLQGHVLVEQQEADTNQAYWPSLQAALLEQKTALRTRYKTRAQELQNEFEPRIDEAAQQLYSQLQDQPALLNTLRAARVTTDAAAVVLAVKSGGLAAADLVIAPAMLSLTTLLTESALGQYMERSKKQLKQEQQALIDEQLFERELGDRLSALSDELNNEQLLLAGYGPLPELSRNNSLS